MPNLDVEGFDKGLSKGSGSGDAPKPPAAKPEEAAKPK
jgi:hypothetical protein